MFLDGRREGAERGDRKSAGAREVGDQINRWPGRNGTGRAPRERGCTLGGTRPTYLARVASPRTQVKQVKNAISGRRGPSLTRSTGDQVHNRRP